MNIWDDERALFTKHFGHLEEAMILHVRYLSGLTIIGAYHSYTMGRDILVLTLKGGNMPGRVKWIVINIDADYDSATMQVVTEFERVSPGVFEEAALVSPSAYAAYEKELKDLRDRHIEEQARARYEKLKKKFGDE